MDAGLQEYRLNNKRSDCEECYDQVGFLWY